MIPADFDQEMRSALRREDPPSGFAARVLAKTAQRAPVRLAGRRPTVLAWALAASLAVGVAVPTAVYQRNYRKQEKAIEAARQLITALNITRTKLKQTRERVQRRSHRI